MAQAYKLRPDSELKDSLERSLNFLSWFIHPDGTFGGEYGSRRTSVYYPGGIALLAGEFPVAAAMTARMLDSISQGSTVTLSDVDFGNMAPLLQNYILASDSRMEKTAPTGYELPMELTNAEIDFTIAGLSIRGTKKYYSIIGISNGGVVKVFDKSSGQKIHDDAGYLARLNDGRFISTQMTVFDRMAAYSRESIHLVSPFYQVLRSIPTPFQFTLLRLANITVMNSIWLGNLIKKVLVLMLIKGEKRFPIELDRTINFKETSVEIVDQISMQSKLILVSLECGMPFSSIHMASSRYFQGQPAVNEMETYTVDISQLMNDGKITRRIEI
jgi:hypothetical protein